MKTKEGEPEFRHSPQVKWNLLHISPVRASSEDELLSTAPQWLGRHTAFDLSPIAYIFSSSKSAIHIPVNITCFFFFFYFFSSCCFNIRRCFFHSSNSLKSFKLRPL